MPHPLTFDLLLSIGRHPTSPGSVSYTEPLYAYSSNQPHRDFPSLQLAALSCKLYPVLDTLFETTNDRCQVHPCYDFSDNAFVEESSRFAGEALVPLVAKTKVTFHAGLRVTGPSGMAAHRVLYVTDDNLMVEINYWL